MNIAEEWTILFEERFKAALYQRIGLKEFWHLPGFDMYDVRRKNLAV